MRLTLAAIVLMGMPALVAAQSGRTAPGSVPPLPSIGLPLPSIGLPLPSIGLPLPPTGLPPVIATPPRVRSSHPSGRPMNQHPRGRHGVRSQPGIIYVVPPFGWTDYPVVPTPTPAANESAALAADKERAAVMGSLWLDVQPAAVMQVYVDGYFVGAPAEFGGELELEAGPHHVEMRAPGFETLALDVRITPQRSLTYRAELKPVRPAPAPAATPGNKPTSGDVRPQAPTTAKPSTFYFIPGCYVGNVAPKDADLPSKCDLSGVIVMPRP